MRIRGLYTHRGKSNGAKPVRPIAKKRFETPVTEVKQETHTVAEPPEPASDGQAADAPCVERDEHYMSFIMDFLGPFLR